MTRRSLIIKSVEAMIIVVCLSVVAYILKQKYVPALSATGPTSSASSSTSSVGPGGAKAESAPVLPPVKVAMIVYPVKRPGAPARRVPRARGSGRMRRRRGRRFTLGDRLRRELGRPRGVVLASEKQTLKALKGQNVAELGDADAAKARVKIGRALSVDAIVVAHLMFSASPAEVDLTLGDARSGRVVYRRRMTLPRVGQFFSSPGMRQLLARIQRHPQRTIMVERRGTQHSWRLRSDAQVAVVKGLLGQMYPDTYIEDAVNARAVSRGGSHGSRGPDKVVRILCETGSGGSGDQEVLHVTVMRGEQRVGSASIAAPDLKGFVKIASSKLGAALSSIEGKPKRVNHAAFIDSLGTASFANVYASALLAPDPATPLRQMTGMIQAAVQHDRRARLGRRAHHKGHETAASQPSGEDQPGTMAAWSAAVKLVIKRIQTGSTIEGGGVARLISQRVRDTISRGPAHDAQVAEIARLRSSVRKALIAQCESRRKAGKALPAPWYVLRVFQATETGNPTSADDFDQRCRLVRAMADSPDIQLMVFRLLPVKLIQSKHETDALKAMTKSHSPALEQAAGAIYQMIMFRQVIKKHPHWQFGPSEAGASAKAGDDDAHGLPTGKALASIPMLPVKRLDIHVSSSLPGARRLVWPRGWIACGPGREVLWDARSLYIMTKPGQARVVFRLSWKRAISPAYDDYRQKGGITGVCYDSKYVWALVLGEQPRVIVLNPRTGKHWSFAANGVDVPLMTSGAVISPLGPEQVCLASAIKVKDGKRQPGEMQRYKHETTVSRIKFDVAHLLEQHVIFRATGNKEHFDASGQTPDEPLGDGFVPVCALTIQDPKNKSRQRVLIRRYLNDDWTLMVNPTINAAKPVAKLVKMPYLNNWVKQGNRVLWRNYQVEEFGFPGPRLYTVGPTRLINRFLNEGQFAHAGKRWFVYNVDDNGTTDGRVWAAPSLTKPLRCIGRVMAKDDELFHTPLTNPIVGIIHSQFYRNPIMLRATPAGNVPFVIDMPKAIGQAEKVTIHPPKAAVTFMGHRYAIYSGDHDITRADAVGWAKYLGGHLAVVDTDAKRAFLTKYIQQHPSYGSPQYWWVKENAGGGQGDALFIADRPAPHRGFHMHGLVVEWPIRLKAKPKPLEPRFAKADYVDQFGIPYVRIPAGEVKVPGRDGKIRTIKVKKPFLLAMTELTWGEYDKITLGELPSHQDGSPIPPDVPWPTDVYGAAERICREAHKATGLTYRLPTKDEWQYACLAGSSPGSAPQGRVKLKQIAWCSYNGELGSAGYVHRVALLKPNAWGLYDMQGNLWELTSTPMKRTMPSNEQLNRFRGARFARHGQLAARLRRIRHMRAARLGRIRARTVRHVRCGGSWIDRPVHCQWDSTTIAKIPATGVRLVIELTNGLSHKLRQHKSPPTN